MFGLLEKFREKYADIRGEISPDTKITLDELKRRILEATEMENIANSAGGKKLIKEVLSYVEKIDSVVMDEQVKGDIKLDLLKQRKCWMTVLRTLMGGKSELDAIKLQVNTYLNISE